MARSIKVLIAEDHEVIREGLKILITAQPGFEIAGEANTGADAVEKARKLQPDVVLLDLAMPKGNGLEASRKIRQHAPNARVLVLSAYQDIDTVQRLVDLGVAGYMTKHSAADELLTAIREVSQGRPYYSSKIAAKLKFTRQNSFQAGRPASAPARLTPREQEVLCLIADGQPNKTIASNLGLSIKTVEKHRQAAMDKLGIHDTASLTRYAMERGLVKPRQDSSTALPALTAS